MPGTDMCIKVGGWVRAEVGDNYNGSLTTGVWDGNAQIRTTSNLVERARGYITADAREQTAYGTARAYIAVGLSTSDTGLNTQANQFSANRAFLQWSGMTVGLSQSFYDFYSEPAFAYNPGNLPGSDTGDPGWWVWGYTAQLGNGLAATVAMEERRMTQIINQNAAGAAGFGQITIGNFNNAVVNNNTGAGVFPSAQAYGGEQAGDVVANLRLDQTWGGAQVMAAWHDVNTAYYANAATVALPVAGSGHPSDTSGFAVGAGLRVNFPSIAQGDYFMSQVNYTEGALGYVFFNQKGFNYGYNNGVSETYGVMSDCVFGGTVAGGTATGCNLTTAWGFNAAYEHYWTPAVHESLYGAYAAVNYNSQANAILCSLTGTGNGAGAGNAAVATAGCNENWSTWGVGSRLQWDVTKTFYLGVDVLYTELSGGRTFNGLLTATNGGSGATLSNVTNEANTATAWVARVRMHKDFLP